MVRNKDRYGCCGDYAGFSFDYVVFWLGFCKE